MNLISLLPCIAGIGLFLFGMNILGSSLERLAGSKMQVLLEKLTSNRAKGALLGTGVTAVIQSSAATTIMVVGLLNAGVFTLARAVPVIMGANVGTTVTAQILRLGDISGGGSIILTLLKPSSFGTILIGIGAVLTVFIKNKKKNDIGYILIGLGMIFFGMSTMEATFAGLRDNQGFIEGFLKFSHPLLGMLLGAGLTALLQSSSASVGILQALSATGVITFSTAIPIILGQNVGKCITVILASIGSKKDAKRAVFINVFNNILGMIAFFIVIYLFQHFVGFSFWEKAVSRGDIANFHSFFNIVTSVCLLPFVNGLINLSKKAIKDTYESEGEKALEMLDSILLNSPNLAVEQCRKTVLCMADIAVENYNLAIGLFDNFDNAAIEKINANEDMLDKFETSIGNYILKITGLDINSEDNIRANEMLKTISDIERIGDYAINIYEVAEFNKDNALDFSENAGSELRIMSGAVSEILTRTLDSYKNDDPDKALEVEPLEEVIDYIQERLKSKHISRLREGLCSINTGISFIEITTNLERIADHCSNVALNVIQNHSDINTDFNSHDVQDKMHNEPTKEYKERYKMYLEKYNVS